MRIHDFSSEGYADVAPVGANELRVGLRDQTFRGWHRGHGIATSVSQLEDGLADLGHANLQVTDHDLFHYLI